MELKIKVLEISPNIKNLKIKQTDILSLSFIAENIVVKIDNIEKNISNKNDILLILREYSPNEKIHFNLIRNDAIIIGTGKFSPTSGIKWYKIYDLVSVTENNINISSKSLFNKKKTNHNFNDSLINSNIKIKLEIQVNINKSKNKLNISNSKNINYSNSKNRAILSGIVGVDEKNNNSVMSPNLNSNFNKYKANQNINSYTATSALKSPRFKNILTRAKSNNTNNNNDSSKENTLKENNILPVLDFEKEKNKKNASSRRTPSGKKFLYQTKKYKTLYGFNRSQVENKNYEKSVENNNILGNSIKGKMSKEIEEKILDKNFQEIIKSDEILKGKEITDFNLQTNNNLDNEENGKKLNQENNYNIENVNNEKNSIDQNKNIPIDLSNPKNAILNSNELRDNNILHENINNELSPNNLKNDFNNMNQISAVSSAISSGRLMNFGGEIDLSGDDLSRSFSAYDNIAKLLPTDENKITSDIELENIEKYENIKNDFILFYNKEYINSINEEMLILELQLMIDKILEMQNVYKKQSIIIQRNFEKFRKKLILFQKRNLLLNKKMNKLLCEKLKNRNHEEMNDLYYNNKKLNFYRNKNIFKSNELSLWKQLTLYLDDKNKKNGISYGKKKLNNIFLIVCNKNINNLNTLSKKFFLEFVEKEKKREKEIDKNKKIIKNKMNNTCNNFYSEGKRKNNLINNIKNKKISNKNSSNKYFKNNNRNDIIENKSNKLLKSNETIKKDSKKDIFLIKETEGNEISLINSNKKIKKGKIKGNDNGLLNNRNTSHKNNFNTMKSFSKKLINKK